MAYNINNNLKGVYTTLVSEPSPPTNSSGIVPLVIVPVNSASLQYTTNANATATSTDRNKVTFNVEYEVGVNQLRGQFMNYVSASQNEVRAIVSSTPAVSGAAVTVTLDANLSVAAKVGGTAQVRAWEKLGKAVAVTSFSQFQKQFFNRAADGSFNMTGSEGGAYTVAELKNNGIPLIYVVPVHNAAVSSSLAANLIAPSADDTFKTDLLALTPQPDVIAVAKQDYGATMSAASWGSVDSAWFNYVKQRAEDATGEIDPLKRELIYVSDAGDVPASAQAITYRTSTTNFGNQGSERCVLVHGRYRRDSFKNNGDRVEVSPVPAFIGTMNNVCVNAPESYGHAMCGQNYGTVQAATDLVEKISPANIVSLAANGIAALVQKAGGVPYWYDAPTQRKNANSSGDDPVEKTNIVVTRDKILNTIRPVLDLYTDEPNNSVTRNKAIARITGFLDSQVANTQISSYAFEDQTTPADENAGQATFALSVASPRGIEFIDLTFTSRFGS